MSVLRTAARRLTADPRFQRFAARFPPTRPIARRRAADAFATVSGFVASQVLAACVALDLLPMLADAPRTTADIAAATGTDPRRLRALLDAAAALHLLAHESGDLFGIGPVGAGMLGNPGIAAMVRHHDRFYADLADPVRLLAPAPPETALRAYWAYARAPESASLGADAVAPYSALMAQSQSAVADQVLDAYPVARHRTLLDIGGGTGAFVRAALARAPHLSATVFDLPSVAELAAAEFARAGLSHRAEAVGGSFFAGDLPRGADLATLVRILHDHDDEPVRALLAATRRALPPGATLLVAEPLAGMPGLGAVDAYFALYFLAMGQGRLRRFAEYRTMLQEAGFARVRLRRTNLPLLTLVIEAE